MKIIIYITLAFLALVLPTEDHENVHLILDTKSSPTAGDRVTIGLSRSFPNDLYLIVDDGYTLSSYTPESGGTHSFNIVLETAGINRLYLLSQEQLLSITSIEVLPKRASYPLDAYLGGKAISVGGNDYALLTVFAQDMYGNPVQDSTLVDFETLRFGEKISTEGYTSHGIAYTEIRSKYKVSQTMMSARVDQISSPVRLLLEKADVPVDFTISTSEISPYTSSQNYFTVKTSILKDQYGNVVDDGTTVYFLCHEADGEKRLVEASTLDGIATADINYAQEEGNFIINGYTLSGAKSNSIEITFESNIVSWPVTLDEAELFVGPVIGKMGELLPNGTPVIISTKDQTKIGELVKGIAHFHLPPTFLKAFTDTLYIEIGSEHFIKTKNELE